ncbi:MAG: hypothetical protein MUF87_17850 [Anaerolineae bacterium]|nr:hypothetical protein [Anaerolineae bacterium]
MIEYGIEPLYAIDEKRSRHIQFVADFTTDRIQGQTALQVGEVIGRVEFSTIQPPVETALARALADVSVPSEPYRVVISARPRDRVWSVRFVPMDSDRAFEERNIAWE